MSRAELRVTTWCSERRTGELMYSASDTTKGGISHINSVPNAFIGRSQLRWAGENLLKIIRFTYKTTALCDPVWLQARHHAFFGKYGQHRPGDHLISSRAELCGHTAQQRITVHYRLTDWINKHIENVSNDHEIWEEHSR